MVLQIYIARSVLQNAKDSLVDIFDYTVFGDIAVCFKII